MTQPSGIEVIGADDLAKVLDQFAPKVANNLMRAVVHGVAGEITKRAKRNAPKKTGNLRKSIKTKRRRGKPFKPVSDVHVTTGSNAKNDGFYWRFIEHGTQTGIAERPFVRPAKEAVMGQLDSIMKDQFKKKLTAAVKREQKKRAKK